MEVYAVIYKAEFNCEEFDDVYLYDTFEKAHDSFVDIAKGWFGEGLFETEMPTESKVWAHGKYYGYYSKYVDEEYLDIEERDNVVNYLSIRVEKLAVN